MRSIRIRLGRACLRNRVSPLKTNEFEKGRKPLNLCDAAGGNCHGESSGTRWSQPGATIGHEKFRHARVRLRGLGFIRASVVLRIAEKSLQQSIAVTVRKEDQE
ncbi:MAG: hypothetical protein ABS95_00650 [Verrucomicrobia bacterium SCN 57-15]|nr:MAG: hypothetical protein ABS95_00650 [Verrucomicrobia bacterium SCN 57-15]